VTVGVIDSGVDTNHPDLTVPGDENTVTDESPGDYGDNDGHHGTHVAGIIAAHGLAGKGMRGPATGYCDRRDDHRHERAQRLRRVPPFLA
jgi:subtilisin